MNSLFARLRPPVLQPASPSAAEASRPPSPPPTPKVPEPPEETAAVVEDSRESQVLRIWRDNDFTGAEAKTLVRLTSVNHDLKDAVHALPWQRWVDCYGPHVTHRAIGAQSDWKGLVLAKAKMEARCLPRTRADISPALKQRARDSYAANAVSQAEAILGSKLPSADEIAMVILHHADASINTPRGRSILLQALETQHPLEHRLVENYPQAQDVRALFATLADAARKGPDAYLKTVVDLDPTTLQVCNSDGMNALHLAAANGDEAMLGAFLKACKDTPNAHELAHMTVLWKEYSPFTGTSAMHLAAAHGHPGCVKVLAQAGVDLRASDPHGRSPLAWAVERDHLPVMELLLDLGVDPNEHPADAVPPIHRARSAEAVKLLCAHGTDVDAATHPNTPGHKTALSMTRSPAVLEALLEEGANPNLGQVLYQHLQKWDINAECVALLIDYGANLTEVRKDAYDKFYSSPLAVACELPMDTEFNKKNRVATVMHLARHTPVDEVERCLPKLLRFLVQDHVLGLAAAVELIQAGQIDATKLNFDDLKWLYVLILKRGDGGEAQANALRGLLDSIVKVSPRGRTPLEEAQCIASRMH